MDRFQAMTAFVRVVETGSFCVTNHFSERVDAGAIYVTSAREFPSI